MTPLERSAAELLCVGFHGDDATSVDVEGIAELGPGGIILFGRNVTTAQQTRALTERVVSAIASRTGFRPFAGVDQEGGRVARFRDAGIALPSMMAVGATDDEDLAFSAGRALGSVVRRFGCDVDFAPNLDLAVRSESRVVGTRSFGDDPVRVGLLGAAVARGLATAGVASVAKHAPGHGDTKADSHDSLPVLDADAATLASRDLVPFCHVTETTDAAVMFAHVVVPSLGKEPASLNPQVVALVRARLGDKPVLMTDCLQMDAIAKTVGTAEAAALAIGSGIDIALVSHDLPLARDAARAIARDVESGRISRKRFEAARANAARFRAYVRSLDAVATASPGDVAAEESAAMRIAAAAIATLRDLSGESGTKTVAPGEAVTVVSFEGTALASAEGQGLAGTSVTSRPSLALALRHRRVRAELLRAPLAPGDAEIEALELVLEGQGARPVVAIARGARFAPGQARAVESLLRHRPDALVVCATEPFDLAVFPSARRVLCTFGDGAAEMEALADVVTGRLEPGGRVPVRLAESPVR